MGLIHRSVWHFSHVFAFVALKLIPAICRGVRSFPFRRVRSCGYWAIMSFAHHGNLR